MKKQIAFLSIILSIFILPFAKAAKYTIYDIGKNISEPKSFATSINDKGQVGGFICSTKRWFIWNFSDGITNIPVNLDKAFIGLGCSPYLDNLESLSELFSNDLGESVLVVDGKLCIRQKNQLNNIIIDNNSEWSSVNDQFNPRINNNSEVVGNIKDQSNKRFVKYVNYKNGTKLFFPFNKFSCNVTGINDLGEVVGWFHIETQNIFHSFLWKPESGEWQIIENFRAAAINNNRIIVGCRDRQGCHPQGAFWENGKVRILDEVLDILWDTSTDLETIEIINDINNSNNMVGWGKAGNQIRAVLIKTA